jgi:hypothetical protein
VVVAASIIVADADALMSRRLTLAERVRDAGDIVHAVVADVATGQDESDSWPRGSRSGVDGRREEVARRCLD